MNEKICRYLICPVCGEKLFHEGGSLVCENRHTYDISKHGYVNMTNTSSKKQSGDSKEMAAARSMFLSSGAYAGFLCGIKKAAGAGRLLVDAGCGEGYYTSELSRSFECTAGFDLSKASVMAAAKRARAEGTAQGCFFGVGSVYSLPIAGGTADCITNIFAPCVEEEYERVLCTGGRLVVACAGAHHLCGMKEVLYDITRDNTERSDLPKRMALIDKINVSYDITLDSTELIRALYMMTPYCYKTGIDAQAKLLSLDSLKTTVDFDIYVYQK